MPQYYALKRFLKHRSFSFLFFYIVSFVVLNVILFLSAGKVYSGQATLFWDAPTTNADGKRLTDLKGYKVYYGTSSGKYSKKIDVGNVTTYTVANLTDGTYYFVVTAHNTSKNESGYSNEVSKTIRSVQQYTLTVNKNGTGSGTITGPVPNTGINCGSDCTELYNQGTIVTLTAKAATGSAFTGWSGGGCTGTGTCSTTINANTNVTANFNKNTYAITATAGTGGNISPSGTVTVNKGETQTFTITANTNYSIANVLVDGSSVGAVSTYTFNNVTAAHTIRASFTMNTYSHTVTKTGTGTGTVTSSPAGISCGSACSYAYNGGTVVTLTAAPDASSTFTGWSGGGCTGTGTCAVTMDAAKTVTATFTLKTYTITASAGAGGTSTPSGTVTVNHGANRKFTITPNAGYHITDVRVDGLSFGAVSTYTFNNVTAKHSIVASFALDTSAQEIIIDNGDPGTSYTGAWYASGGTGPYDTDSLWSRNGTYTWTFTPQQTGVYELSMWWTYFVSRSANIPVDIEYSDGTTRVSINQYQNGSMWNSLGTYPFAAGTSYKVTITAQGSLTTCADAVKFAQKLYNQ